MHFEFHNLVVLASSLNPREAITPTGIRREMCLTPTVDAVTINGNVTHLTGKLCAGYVRVSTERQKADGFSVEEQIHRIIHYFASERRQPFVIYSDATLSGFYPPRNPRLIAKMIEGHARRYEHNFRAIFLTGKGVGQYSEIQRESMIAHMHASLASIRRSQMVTITEEGEITLQRAGKIVYRPALTLLLDDLPQYDVLAVSDLSRLYRNQALAEELTDRLQADRCDCTIIGLIESLDYLNKEGFEEVSSQFQRWFFSMMAEKQLNTITINTLRGTLQMLEQGKPHAKLPYFLTRDKEGRAIYKPQARASLLRLVELVMTPGEDGQRRSYIEIGEMMRQEGHTGLGHKQDWSRRRITDMLSNRALIGKHGHFGLEWDIVPRLLDDNTFERLQVMLQDTKARNPHHQVVLKRTHLKTDDETLREVCYLATGLMRCVCSGRMCHHPYRGFEGYICINQIDNKRPDIRHTRLLASDLHDFLAVFFSHYHTVFAKLVADDTRYEELREATRQANNKLVEHKVELERLQAGLRNRLGTEAQQEGFEGRDLDEYVALRLRNATKVQRQETIQLEQQRDALEAQLSLYTLQQGAERLQERIEQWTSLDTSEQNAILLTIFDRWEVRGMDPHCYVVPIFRNQSELPPIPLVTSVQRHHATHKEVYTRRFPTIHQYIDSIYETRLGKTQSAN